MPDFRAFWEEAALPALEVGPVERCALRRFASVCLSVAKGVLVQKVNLEKKSGPVRARCWWRTASSGLRVAWRSREAAACWTVVWAKCMKRWGGNKVGAEGTEETRGP